MLPLSSWLRAVGVGLGAVGFILCLAATIVFWLICAQLDRATDAIFDRADRSYEVISSRVVQARDRIASAVMTTKEVQQTLADWTKQDAKQRLAVRLKVEQRSEQLSAALLQTNQWLEMAESSASLVQGMLVVVGSADDGSSETIIDSLVEQLSSLREQSAAAMELLNELRDRIFGDGDDPSLGDRIEQAAKLTIRVLATVGSLNSRLNSLVDRLPAGRSQLEALRSKTHWWIGLGRLAGSLLAILMAAGQVALCVLVLRGKRIT